MEDACLEGNINNKTDPFCFYDLFCWWTGNRMKFSCALFFEFQYTQFIIANEKEKVDILY